MKKKIILSWSGGKDSALALYALKNSPEHEITSLFTTVTKNYDRISMHGIKRSLIEKQAVNFTKGKTVLRENRFNFCGLTEQD